MKNYPAHKVRGEQITLFHPFLLNDSILFFSSLKHTVSPSVNSPSSSFDATDKGADRSIRNVQNAVTGANSADKHLKGVRAGRDFEADMYADIRLAKDGDKCPVSRSGVQRSTRGIEVGHVFKLGTKYSETMNATFSDVDSREKP